MTSTEQLLSQAVATNPGDWGLRADLLAKQVERGGLAEANQTLLEAPVAVPDEALLHRITDLTGKLDECSAGIRQVLAWFIGANPESGFARLLQAQVTHHAGDHATALAQYRAAKKRDASLIDPHLDALHAAAVARIAAALGSDYGVVAPEEEAAARDRILMTVKVLKAAREACQLADRNLDALANDDKRIRALCATEGIGKVVGTGLAIAIAHAETHGNERDAASQHIGAAPVTSKSGTMGDRNPHITMRRTASSTMKAIAFLCGIQLVRNHAWAKAAFTHYKSRGKTTASAYRRITRSFLRVTRALLRDGSTFDEARYISALKSRRVEWAMAL